jgi:glycosyltransferase involved in cell wall biosynthesis
VSLVDVVIPAFDAADHLREAVASVRAQTHAVARVIVVDDGSSDATAQIAAELGAPVELVRMPVNRGAAAARNAGIAASSAPLVAFLDADDRWLPDKLARQCAALAADATLAFALCGIAPFMSPGLDAAQRARIAVAEAPRDGWHASALVVRRAVLARVGGFAEDLRFGEVIDWFSRARELPHVIVDAVGVERRLHARNTTRLAQVTGHDYLEAARRHLARRRARDAG